MKIRFVCSGDATQDLFFFVDDEKVAIDKEQGILGLQYGEKIPVEKVGATIGGNAANVAVGLRKLGLDSSLLTTFGDDERGVWIKKRLMESGVDISECKMPASRESNVSSIIVYQGERTILTYHGIGEDKIKAFPQSEWIYLTSSSGRDSTEVFKQALEKMNGEKAQLGFNPGGADIAKGKQFLAPVLRYCSVLFLNFEEAEHLVGSGDKGTGDSQERQKRAKELLSEIANLGPKVVAITDGKQGAYCRFENSDYFCVVSNFERVEATGAGDAFTSGFLASWVQKGEVSEAMRWGMANSGSVVTKIGGQEGLLTDREIEKTLEGHSEIQVIKI